MSESANNLIYEHVKFERNWMRFERTMWLLLSLMLLAACAGVFGRGWFARQTQRSGGFTVEYDRVLRSRTQVPLVVQYESTAVRDGQVRLVLTGSITDKARVFDIVPKPSSETVLDRGMALTFKAPPASAGTVTITQKVDGVGRIQSHVGGEGAAPVTVDQIVLP